MPPLVMVLWEDATVLDHDNWASDTASHDWEPQLIVQVGFLLHKSKKGIVLTSALGDGFVAARDQIPMGMVRELHYLSGN